MNRVFESWFQNCSTFVLSFLDHVTKETESFGSAFAKFVTQSLSEITDKLLTKLEED